MAYCTLQMVQHLLPKTLTIGETKVLNEVQQSRPANIAKKTAGVFIHLASQQIDARLSTIYETPIRRIKVWEEDLYADLSENAETLRVSTNAPFSVGGTVRVSDGSNTYLFAVEEVSDTASAITEVKIAPKSPYTFSSASSIVSIIEFPNPIPDICARMAVGMIIDKEFTATQSPDISSYGKSMRTMASNSMDKIMTGAARLEGQEFVSRRFVTTALRDTWNTTAEIQAGGEKE